MMFRLLMILSAVALFGFSGCSNEDVVARCGDFEITVDNLRYEVLQLGPSYRFDGSMENRMRLVENLTARYILADEAAVLGFGEGVESAEAEVEKAAVGEAYGEWKIEKSVRVPRISSLKWREKLDRSLHLKDVTFRSRAAAEDALLAVLKGATYETLETVYAGDEIVIFNDVGYKVWAEIDRALAKHVFPLEPGQFSGIVNLADGYHLFFVADAKPLGMKEQVLFLRAKKFDRGIKEERLKRQNQRELLARYDFKPDPDGVNTAMEAFSLAFAGERAPQEMLEKPVATYEGGQVLVADLFNSFFNSPPESRFYAGDGYAIMKAAWEMALPELYVRAGYDMRLDNLYGVRWAVNKARHDYLVPQMEDYFRREIDVTDADIEQYYRDRGEDLMTPVTYRARRILLETRNEADRVAAEIRAGRDFADLAEQYSHDDYTAAKGGDMGPVNQGIVAVYDSIIDGLEPGEVSQAFETNSGIEFLKLEELAGGRKLTFEEALPYIEMFIRNQAANDMLADLVTLRKEEWGFSVNEDMLASVWLPEPEWRKSIAMKVEED